MDWLRQLPMGQYVDGEQGWIRHVDVRLKLGWTLAFLITPILANGAWRLGLVGLLLLLTVVCGLPGCCGVACSPCCWRPPVVWAPFFW